MTKRQHTEFAQVAVGQRREQACVNVVVTECLRILAKSQALQPRFNA
jgi:hypothetical protein